MGLLSNGEWILEKNKLGRIVQGRFDREPTRFHNTITRDGSSGYPPDLSRYHLYISLACPWAHRTLITRNLKNLESKLQVSIVDPILTDEDGWVFSEYPGSTLDPINGFTHLRQVYLKSEPTCSGRVTVPVLFDTVSQKIVNNESSEIIKMLNDCFDGPDFYPIYLREKIDRINEWVYDKINNGVYKAGFATSQEAYDEAVTELFQALDQLESILNENRYLVGSVFTLADIRLFTTLVRFDVVYVRHFKCNLRTIRDYENIWNYLKEIYQMSKVTETVNFNHIKKHYFESHKHLNPTGIVPVGPVIDFLEPHNRSLKFSL